MRIICWLRTIWYTIPSIIRGSFPISGHDYYETYQNNDVQILKCMQCGHYSIGYFNDGEPNPPQKDEK